MVAANQLRGILDKAEKVEPIAEKNGVPIVSFEDSATMANMENIDPTPKTGLRTYNDNGTLARIRYHSAAINPAQYFANRFKKTQKRLKVVIDWRAITEQGQGKIYTTQIPAYVFIRNDKGDLEVDRIELVSDTEFCSDYTYTLNEAAMREIAPLIASYGTHVEEMNMPI